MRELLDLAERLRELGDRPAALVTVARVEGSSYRREGARMLVEPDGRLTGVLTGGCLERDLVALAGEVLESGAPRAARFDLTAEAEAYWGTGTGCQGLLTLLVEPLDPPRRDQFASILATVLEERREVRQISLVESGPAATSRPVAARPNGGDRLTFPFNEGDVIPTWAAAAGNHAASIAPGTAKAIEVVLGDERALVLVESILPPVHLLLLGAERDAPPLARLADELGWKVTVVESRGPERDASALPVRAVRVVAAPRELAAAVELSPRTAAVLATHRYLDDLAYLEPLVAAPLGYLALLGPVRRRERLLGDLAKRAPAAARAAAERLRGPAGLDLGGRSPHEVALAIVAEIQAALHAADARPLTERASRDARPATP